MHHEIEIQTDHNAYVGNIQKDEIQRGVMDFVKVSFGEKFNPESVRIVPFERLFIETDQSEFSIEEIYHQIAAAKNCKIHELSAGNLFINEFSSIL